MVAQLTTVPRVVGPFFVHAVSVDTVFLDSADGTNKIPTLSVAVDVIDANNDKLQVGLGMPTQAFADVISALLSELNAQGIGLEGFEG